MKVTISQSGPPFHLEVTSYGRTAIAGPRVLRGGLHPDVQFSHVDTHTAEIHAQRLQQYFDDLARSGKVSKRALRAFGS